MKNLFGKKQKSRQTASNATSDDDSDVYETMDSLANDCGDDISDDELMGGDFVVVNIHGMKGTTQRYVTRVDVIDGDEIEGIFMKRIRGHKPTESKQGFILDHSDEASFDKKDIVVTLPAHKFVSGRLRKSNQFVFPCDLERFNLS